MGTFGPVGCLFGQLENDMSISKNHWLFSGSMILICIGLWFLDIGNIPQSPKGLHDRALVLEVDNRLVRTHMIVRTGEQILRVRLLGGPAAGQEFTMGNRLTGKMELDEYYVPGATILVEYDIADGKPLNGLARGYFRLHYLVLLLLLFGVLLCVVGGRTGFNALLSFLLVAMVLWKLFFPMLLKGYPPIWTGLVIATLLTGFICLSVGGLNRRGVSAFLGSLSGISLTCVLAVISTKAFHLHGAIQPFSETLLYSGYYGLNLTDIFIASVFIASSGAVMDLAMDISASMEEIKWSQQHISFVAHLASGLRVGRAALGTMATTLLLAYSISHSTMFMFFMAKGLPPENLLNAPFVSAELLNILIGSFGLIAVAPLTALISALFCRIEHAVEYSIG